MSEMAQLIFDVYLKEEKRFVKSSYLDALANMDIEKLIPDIVDCKLKIESEDINDSNRKHIQEELRSINKILIKEWKCRYIHSELSLRQIMSRSC